MPHLLRVKKDYINDFKGLFPYGPFNRLVYNPVGIYLESGFLDLVLRGFYNFKSYTPALIEINKLITPIVGLMTFQFKKIDASIVPLENRCGFLEVETTRNFCLTETRESKALNCDVKTDTITMIDPRGEGKDCTTTYIPKIPSPPMFTGTSLITQMQYVEVQAINTTIAGGDGRPLEQNFLSSGFRDTCIDRKAVEKEYKGESKIFCPNGILYKKYCQQKFPPSLYTGKLKLYIQSIYGGNYVEYKNEQGSFITMLYIGPTFIKSVKPTAARTSVLGRGTHILHTDSLGNYYLIATGVWSINPLVPNFQGTLLKRYLKSLDLNSGVQKDAFEAYILTTCLPTRNCFAINKPYHHYGAPLDFGWKANWDGTTLAQVAFTTDANNYRVSTLLKVDISSSGIEQLYEEEIERKKENLLLQEERKKLDYVQLPGVYPIYSSTVKVISAEIIPGVFDHCFDGDLEDGEWYYDVLGYDEKVNSNELQESKTEAEKKNKTFGGLPYSEQFFIDLPTYFEFTLSPGESNTWMEKIQTDKIFSWDPYYSDFSWAIGCNPLEKRNPGCPSATPGTFPIYCWFDRRDSLQMVNYTCRSVSEMDHTYIPPEGICGAGSDYYKSETFKDGSVSGFEMNSGVGLTSMAETYSETREGNMTVSAEGWSPCWLGRCGPYGGCSDDKAEPGNPPIGGCFVLFWTSWQKNQSGSGNSFETKDDMFTNHFTCCVIPSDDAEGVYLGVATTATGTSKENTIIYDHTLTVAVQESGIAWPYPEIKKTIKQSQGWITCTGLWFCHTWGNQGGCDILTPEYWSCCWCGYYVGDPPVNVPTKKWGPSGNDTPVVVAKVSPFGPATTDETVIKPKGHASFKACFVGKDGKKITIKELEKEITDLKDPYISGVGEFYKFLQPIDLRWTYAQSGNILGSIQTVQNLKNLRHPLGNTTDPVQFPYKNKYYPVGYV